MTKNLGWAYETELRIAIVDLHLDDHELDALVSIPLRDCLKAVIFGDAHPAPSVIARGIQPDMGSDAPEFFQCQLDQRCAGIVPAAHLTGESFFPLRGERVVRLVEA